MTSENIILVEEIFLIIDKGIIDIYDYLSLDVACGNGYIDIEVTIEKNGLVIDNTRIDINNAILYNAVMRLRENAHQRGEYWISFVMSYSQGEQVKIQFRYNES